MLNKIKLKSVVGASAGLGVAMWAVAASAGTLTSTDTTLAQAYHGASVYHLEPGCTVSPYTCDTIGPAFDTNRVVVTASTTAGMSTLTIQYITQFSGSETVPGLPNSIKYADIFIGYAPDSYSFGISLGTHSNSGVAAGLYDLGSPGYKTSQQIWQGNNRIVYGGRYLSPFGNGLLNAPTEVSTSGLTGSTLDPSGFILSEIFGANPYGDVGTYPYSVQVSLTAPTDLFNFYFGTDLYLFWATGDCNNDSIETAVPADITTQNVPEPLTLSLFGAGLVGAAGLRRRNKTKNK